MGVQSDDPLNKYMILVWFRGILEEKMPKVRGEPGNRPKNLEIFVVHVKNLEIY